jgi:branched-chain amino acid aminotransferase
LAADLQKMYFRAARGEWDKYRDWTVPIEVAAKAAR